MAQSWQAYDKAPEEFTKRYEAVSFPDVHEAWKQYWPEPNSMVLDVGAGTGRDAAYLAAIGCQVVAVEPSVKLREFARNLHPHPNIQWLDDHLPALEKVFHLNLQFDVILVSAVLMHIAPLLRERAFRKLISLLKPNGRLAITIRLGLPDEDREMYPVSTEELEKLGASRGMEMLIKAHRPDRLGRAGISWSYLVFEKPDDGTSGLLILRQIIVNDSKSATYKLALLKVLLKIANGAAGYAERKDEKISLPMGLVALYWIRAYKEPMRCNYYQAPKGKVDKGFRSALSALGDISIYDLQVGRSFEKKSADVLIPAIVRSSWLITHMPVHFIHFAQGDRQVFDVDSASITKHHGNLGLDRAFLETFGKFSMPVRVWESLVHHEIWIEPAIRNEWIRLMRQYSNREISYDDGENALKWNNEERETSEVRCLIDLLKKKGDVRCVWSGQSGKLEVDHCIPFSVWENNGLWNLMPATKNLNLGKSDRLPSADLLQRSKERILEWWQKAYIENSALKMRFQVEIEAALPLAAELWKESELEGYFESLLYQIKRLKSDQQLEEWGGD